MPDQKSPAAPLVSVIIPAYNCESYIEAAVTSISAQTYRNLEIIVVNDCSTDRSGEIIEALAKKDDRIRPFHNPQNIKQTRTRNFGISQAKGTFVALMDGDDVRSPDSIEKQVAFLKKYPEVVAVGTAAEICDEHMNRLNDRLYPTSDQEIRRKFFRYSPFCLASLVIKRDCLEPEAYKVEMEPAEDIDLTLRLGKIGKLANLPEVLYQVRTHKRSVTQTYARTMEKNTLYLRIKAVFEYGYTMTFSDKVYFLIQLGTMYLMPPRFRFWFFNKIRGGSA